MSKYIYIHGKQKISMLVMIIFCGLIFPMRAVSEQFDFAIIGDMPYDSAQKMQYRKMMKVMDTADLGFVVHVGDFWGDGVMWRSTTIGLPPCADETYSDRLKLAQESSHPFIFTPGDNDWTDCHRAKPASYDPAGRLDKLRKMFFAGERSLGKKTITLERQSNIKQHEKFRENVRWSSNGVLFITLHMVGSNNNFGRTTDMDAEFIERNDANLFWLHDSFDRAKRNGSKAVMVIAHANPQFESKWSAKLRKRYLLGGLGIKPSRDKVDTAFDDFLEAIEEETISYKKPVIYVHGDTHTFRIDKPLVGSISGSMIENFTRVETIGFRGTHWLLGTIDHDDPNVLRLSTQIGPENKVKH